MFIVVTFGDHNWKCIESELIYVGTNTSQKKYDYHRTHKTELGGAVAAAAGEE